MNNQESDNKQDFRSCLKTFRPSDFSGYLIWVDSKTKKPYKIWYKPHSRHVHHVVDDKQLLWNQVTGYRLYTTSPKPSSPPPLPKPPTPKPPPSPPKLFYHLHTTKSSTITITITTTTKNTIHPKFIYLFLKIVLITSQGCFTLLRVP